MNKKIYYNNDVIVFGEMNGQTSHYQEIIILQDRTQKGLTKFISQILNEEKGKSKRIYQAKEEDFDLVFEFLTKNYKYIVAGGGLIKKGDTYLFIKRLGKWDLPKGKLDKGEKIEACAIRECEEECAVSGLKILRPLPSTFHLYPFKESYALKQSYWFEMETEYEGELKPQTEENIEEVKWFKATEVKDIVLNNTYLTIADLVNFYFNFS